MNEELMQRISAALDGEGIAGDAELQRELRADPVAARYVKDVTRVNMWLATWPLPEPDAAAFEALASRIEQRLDGSLPAIADPTEPPIFDDDDALRDATAQFLTSGEYRLSDAPLPPVAARPPPPPPVVAPAPAAVARIALEKKAARGAVEEPSGETNGEPRSAADLELSLAEGKPKRKKKAKAPPAVPGREAKPAAPALRVGGKSADRISIPTPAAPLASKAALAPVTELRPVKEPSRSGAFWAFAAAACVGLGVFGAATLYEGTPSEPVRTGSTIVTATTSVAPVTAPVEAPPPPPAAVPVPPSDDEPAAAAPTAPMPAAPMPTAPTPAPVVAAPRVEASPRSLGGSLYEEAAVGTRRARATTTATGGAASGPAALSARPTPSAARSSAPAAPATTPTAPPRVDAAEAMADLPETPDRGTIQAVLQGVEPAVRACSGEEHGTADVDVVITGSGRVTTATVHGPFAGTPIGSCIARAVRGAHFPPFAQPRLEVTYPYHL